MGIDQQSMEILVDGVPLAAEIVVPEQPRGVVLFAHGKGSSRYGQRNRYLAAKLQDMQLATVLVDLLTPMEGQRDAWTGEFSFDICQLSARVASLAERVATDLRPGRLGIGLFGASTGAAVALVAAAKCPDHVQAVVSRGGRPDLVAECLPKVCRPTLFIVGGRDQLVIDSNRAAMRRLGCESRMEIVPGATHLFEEPGALDQVAGLTADWFTRHLRPTGQHTDQRCG